MVHVLRRFGCRLCRANAAELAKVAPLLEANNVRVVAVGMYVFNSPRAGRGGAGVLKPVQSVCLGSLSGPGPSARPRSRMNELWWVSEETP